MDRKESELGTDEAERLSRPDDVAVTRAESLLLQGDELFARGQIEQAVHLWTRILFLDRGNRDARVRIEKAKASIAERERLLDERVVEARRVFEAGQIESARSHLRSVLDAAPRHADALRLLEDMTAQLGRGGAPAPVAARDAEQLESARSHEAPARSDSTGRAYGAERALASGPSVAPAGGLLVRVSRRRRSLVSDGRPGSRWKIAAFLLAVSVSVVTAGFLLLDNWESIVNGRGAVAEVGRSEGVGGLEAVRPPDLAELRYYNGARLFDKGRYREALAELGRVDRSSKVAPRARSLILRIEERLLRGVEETVTQPEPVREPESESEGVEP